MVTEPPSRGGPIGGAGHEGKRARIARRAPGQAIRPQPQLPDVAHRTPTMSSRLLLSSFLLALCVNAQAATDRVHAASDGASPPCPPSVLAEPAALEPGKPETGIVPAPRPAPTPHGGTQRPGLRWHSFLPGMMK